MLTTLTTSRCSSTFLQHVTASNVAPQYGTEETRAYLKLCDVEQLLVDNGLCSDPSDLRNTLLVKAIKTERWRKWMTGDDVNLQVDDILKDERSFRLRFWIPVTGTS